MDPARLRLRQALAHQRIVAAGERVADLLGVEVNLRPRSHDAPSDDLYQREAIADLLEAAVQRLPGMLADGQPDANAAPTEAEPPSKGKRARPDPPRMVAVPTGVEGF